jgi:hypothetical protein
MSDAKIGDVLDQLFPVAGPNARVPRKPSEADLLALEGEFAGGGAPPVARAQSPAPRAATPPQQQAAPASSAPARPATPPQRPAPTPAARAVADEVAAALADDLDELEKMLSQATAAQQRPAQPAAQQRPAQPAAQQRPAQPAAPAVDPETARLLALYRKTIGDLTRPARRRSKPTPQQWAALDARAKQLFVKLDDRQSFAQVIAHCGMPEVHATYLMAVLVQQGLVG